MPFLRNMGHPPTLFLLYFVFSNIKIFTTNKCETMSIQYLVLRFEPTTFRTWVSSHYHKTRDPSQTTQRPIFKINLSVPKLSFQVLFSPEYEVVYTYHQGAEVELPIVNAELEDIKVAHQVWLTFIKAFIKNFTARLFLMGQVRPLFHLFWSFQTNIITFFTTNKCENMSIQYTVSGFKLTTFGTWVSSHNH